MSRALILLSLIASFSANAQFDGETDSGEKFYYPYNGVEYPSVSVACGIYVSTKEAEQHNGITYWQKELIEQQSPIGAYQCRALGYHYDGYLKKSTNIILAPVLKPKYDDEKSQCQLWTGHIVPTYMEYGNIPSKICLSTCELVQSGVGITMFDDETGEPNPSLIDYKYTGDKGGCATAADGPAAGADGPTTGSNEMIMPAAPGEEFSTTDQDGETTTETAPEKPEGVPDNEMEIPQNAGQTGAGGTMSSFTASGGEQIFVISSSTGETLYTDQRPAGYTGTPDPQPGNCIEGGGCIDENGGITTGGTDTGGGGTGATDGTGSGTDGTGTGEEGGECLPPADCGEEDQGSASGGLDCSVAPVCSGKAVECAIVYQAWETRCEALAINETLNQEIDEGAFANSGLGGEIIDDIISLKDGVEGIVDQDSASGLIDATDIDTSGELSDALPSGGNFSFMNVNLMGQEFPMGNAMNTHYPKVEPAFNFILYLLTAYGIYMMWFQMIGGIKA